MRSSRLLGFAAVALLSTALATPLVAADKADAPPPIAFGAAGKGAPEDPAGKGQSGPHAGPTGVPANDLCANAQTVAVPSSTAGTTTDATLDSVGFCGTSNEAPGVWYIFTPTQTGPHSASTCSAADYDTKISVFTGACGGLACVGGNDDASGCSGFTSRVSFAATAGVPVRVLVHGFGTATGNFTLSITGPAANDLCDDAIPVAVPSTTAGNTTGASVDGAFPQCGSNAAANPTAPGIWYEVTGTGNLMRASTCNQASYDTQLTVFCQDCATPTCVNGNDDVIGTCAGFSSQVDWESEAGATYRILVHGFSTAAGAFNLSVSDLGVPSVEPVACTGPAGACCDPTTAGCLQVSELFCALNGGTWAEGLPCVLPGDGTINSYPRAPALAIPDNDTTGVADTVTVPDSFLVYGMSVDVGITHTWIGDLRIRLENVATGEQINMWNRQCTSTDNINATFIDGGLTTLCADIPPGGAQVDPTVAGLGPAFSTLDGTPAAGDWRLIVDDNFGGDTGTLNTWSLNLGVGVPVCYAYPVPQEIPTLGAKGIATLAVLLAGAAAFLLWRRRG